MAVNEIEFDSIELMGEISDINAKIEEELSKPDGEYDKETMRKLAWKQVVKAMKLSVFPQGLIL